MPGPQGREEGTGQSVIGRQVFVFIPSSSFLRVLMTSISALAIIADTAEPQRQTL